MKRSRRGRLALALLAAALAVTASGTRPHAAREQVASPAERLYLDAERLESRGERDAALEQYELVVQRFPTSPFAPAALLHVAQARWTDGDAQSAQDAVARLTQAYASSPSAAGALVLEGQMQVASARSLADLRDAKATFGRVPLLYGQSRYPDLASRLLARVNSGDVSLLLGELDEAAGAFLAAIEDEPPSAGTGLARVGLATVLLRRGQWAEAAEILQRVVNTAASRGGAQQNVTAVETARRRLSLIHRLFLRRVLGQSPWSNARSLVLSEQELRDPIGVDATEDGRLLLVDEGVAGALSLDRRDFAAIVDPDGRITRQVRPPEVRFPWWGPRGTPYVLTQESVVLPSLVAPAPVENEDEAVEEELEQRTFELPRPEEPRNEPIRNLVAGARGLFGDWFLLDTDPRRVLVFGGDGNYRSILVERDDEPVDLALDFRGRLYVLNRDTKNVVRFGLDGSPEGQVAAGQWRRPEALALDVLGNLYVLDRDAKKVEVFDQSGQWLAEIGPVLPTGVELRQPRDLAVDGTGRVYIADRSMSTIVIVE